MCSSIHSYHEPGNVGRVACCAFVDRLLRSSVMKYGPMQTPMCGQQCRLARHSSWWASFVLGCRSPRMGSRQPDVQGFIVSDDTSAYVSAVRFVGADGVQADCAKSFITSTKLALIVPPLSIVSGSVEYQNVHEHMAYIHPNNDKMDGERWPFALYRKEAKLLTPHYSAPSWFAKAKAL